MPSYYLDNFKHPYLRFEERFAWPSIHLIDTSGDEIVRIRALLKEHWPGFGSGFAVWQNDAFSGNQKYLSFVYQSDRLKRFDMMLELRVLIGYAGGAEPDEIRRQPEQNRSPEFFTDRIYFKALLLPVEELVISDRAVHRIDILTFAEILEASRYSLHREQKEIWTTALFDSIDYTFIQDRLRTLLSSLEPWNAGPLFTPVLIERMTFCLNLLSVDQAENMAEVFRELIDHIQHDDLRQLAFKDRWVHYNAAWELERTLSRSGNPHWRFVRYPGQTGQW